MPHTFSRSLLCLCVSLAAGCVSRAKYDDLARDLEQSQADLTGARDTAKNELARCTDALGAATSRAESCEQRLAARDLEVQRQAEAARLADYQAQELQADLRALQEQLARVVKDKARLSSSVEQMKAALEAPRTASARRRSGSPSSATCSRASRISSTPGSSGCGSSTAAWC